MTLKNYNEFDDIIPDYIIDSFYNRIKSRLDKGAGKDSETINRELNRIIIINGTIPNKIKKLLE